MMRQLWIVPLFAVVLTTAVTTSPAVALDESERLWLVGERAFADMRYVEARQSFDRFLGLYPADRRVPMALVMLGRARLMLGEREPALRAFRRAQWIQPSASEELEARFWEAEALFRLSRHREASAAYDDIVRHGSPFAADALYGYARSELALNRLESAVTLFYGFLGAWPEHAMAPRAAYLLGTALIALKRFNEALFALAGLVIKHRDHRLATAAQLLVGNSQLRLGRFAEAVATFEALDAMPVVDQGSRNEALMGIGRVREAQREWCEALAAYAAVAGKTADPELREWVRVRAGAVKGKLASADDGWRAPRSRSLTKNPLSPGATPLFWALARQEQCTEESAAQAHSHRRACEEGDPRGCSSLGIFYEQGLGVAWDLALAAAFYRLGCDGGDAVGCSGLGVLYQRGGGVAKSLIRAARLYRRACDGGDGVGCANLAVLYETGAPSLSGDTHARALYRRACDLGERLACEP